MDKESDEVNEGELNLRTSQLWAWATCEPAAELRGSWREGPAGSRELQGEEQTGSHQFSIPLTFQEIGYFSTAGGRCQ